MFTTLELVGLVTLAAAILGAGFLIQRLDAVISPDTDGPEDGPSSQPPAIPAPAGRKRGRRR